MPLETHIDMFRFPHADREQPPPAPAWPTLARLFPGKAAAGAALAMAFAVSIPSHAQDQYPPPPPAQPQYQYPAPPAPPQYQYPPPPPVYAQPVAPVAPPGAIWVGGPGECLYGNGMVYWCAPGVVFGGFPVGWNFARHPILSIAAGIVVDPIWFDGWRRGHPGFAFHGRMATEAERRAFAEHRNGIIHGGAQHGHPDEHDRKPE